MVLKKLLKDVKSVKKNAFGEHLRHLLQLLPLMYKEICVLYIYIYILLMVFFFLVIMLMFLSLVKELAFGVDKMDEKRTTYVNEMQLMSDSLPFLSVQVVQSLYYMLMAYIILRAQFLSFITGFY